MFEAFDGSPESVTTQYFAADREAAAFIASMIRQHFGSDIPQTIDRLNLLESAGHEDLEDSLMIGWDIHLSGRVFDDIDGDVVTLEVRDLGYVDTAFASFTIDAPKSCLKQGTYSHPDVTTILLSKVMKAVRDIARKIAKGNIL